MSDERRSIGGGARLRAAREARGTSIESVAAELRIRVPVIRGLEAEDPTYLPERIYTLGMLRTYAAYLELDPEAIVGSWAGFPAITRAEATYRSEEPKRLSRLSGGGLRSLSAYGGIGLLAMAVVLFVGAQVVRYASPPSLTIESPAEEISTLDADTLSIEMHGTSNPAAQIRIQRLGGETITAIADETGLWSVEVPLDRGKNELSIAALDDGTGTESAETLNRILIVPLPTGGGPKFELLAPGNGARIENAPVRIDASTEPGQVISVTATPTTGDPVITQFTANSSGNIASDLLLPAGEWRLSLTAAGLGGAASTIERSVTVRYAGVVVTVEATGSGSWVRAWSDGVVDPTTGSTGLTLVKGGRFTIKATRIIELRFGSPASLTLSLNGRILARLGEVGVSGAWAFSSDGNVRPSNRR